MLVAPVAKTKTSKSPPWNNKETKAGVCFMPFISSSLYAEDVVGAVRDADISFNLDLGTDCGGPSSHLLLTQIRSPQRNSKSS